MKPSPARLGGAILIGAGIFVFGAGMWTGFQSRYQATARIKIVGDTRQPEPIWQGKEIPQPIQAGIAAVYASLDSVAASRTVTGSSSDLNPLVAIKRLRRDVHVQPVRNTSVLEIQVASRNPEEAARIANKIAAAGKQLPRVEVVDAATTPTRRVFTKLSDGLKWLALGGVFLLAGSFVWFDTRRCAVAGAA